MKNNDEQLFSADTKLLDTNIEEELGKINNLNSTQKIAKSKSTLIENLKKKAEIAGELSPTGSKLKELVKDKFQDRIEI